jgi:hypothetical protein
MQTRRPSYLVPNIKEYGWVNSTTDPTNTDNQARKNLQESSYYFGLAWSGYTNGFTGSESIDRLNEIIDCEDTFYEFQFNKVYTVSSLIDQYKKGRGRGRFIGIKEIDDDSCDSTINKFPVNDGFKNFDLLFFLFSIIFTILQPTGLILLAVAHILIFLYNLVLSFLCWLSGIGFDIRIFSWYPFRRWRKYCSQRDTTLSLPMITYPDCQACDCKQDFKETANRSENSGGSGVLSYLSSPTYFNNLLSENYFSADTENSNTLALMFSESLAGFAGLPQIADNTRYKIPLSQEFTLASGAKSFTNSYDLPIGERINIFNQRKTYFTGQNKIKVTFAKNSNIGKHHYDNTITVLSQEQFSVGELITFVNITASTDTNYLYSATTSEGIITGISGETYNGAGQTQVSVSYATTQTTNIVTPVVYNLPYGSNETNYKFPSDIEYYQVVTAITVSQASQIWNTGTTQTFGNIINSPTLANKWAKIGGAWFLENNISVNPYEFFEGGEEQYILILQRGVDPYSPKYVNEFCLGNLFGTNESDPNWIITAETRMNIPIQKLDVSNISVQPYSQSGMYYQSYFFKPGTTTTPTPGQSFTGYTTTNTAYYGSLDTTTSPIPTGSVVVGNSVIVKTSNGFYFNTPSSSKYDESEDLSGMGVMKSNLPTILVPTNASTSFGYYYTTNTFFGLNPTITMSNRTLNVLRTDRLPSSDGLDGSSFTNNPSLLQQNINFNLYLVDTTSEDITSVAFTTGAEIPTADLEGLPNGITVLSSFDCQNMVGLDCYTGFGDNFEVNQECTTKDAVEKGCYMFLRRPLLDLGKDINNFGEWGFRFRFFYGLCRGVLAQSFMNNWINGSLYFFPIQVDTFYNKQNRVGQVRFCEDVVYYNRDSNNFYYRSSPYNFTTNKFVGKIVDKQDGGINDLNLLFPTTIINLGMKDYFYSEITFDSSTRGYILPNISPTSYADTSDLVNLFVVSRITDENFLQQLIPLGDNSINQLFSRDERRIDGDLAQLMSINSEIGNINFSPEYYDIESGETNQPTQILGTAEDPTIAVWFSSTTEDLQTKDYLAPGRINFRGTDDIGYYPYPYGIKSQVVPFYQWKLANTNIIFGNQNNTWATSSSDIVQNVRYQSLDRYASDTPYFYSDNSESNDLNARGYIFNVNGTVGNGTYKSTGALKQKFVVGAPFQFYFGTIVGETALDKFKTKYSVDE